MSFYVLLLCLFLTSCANLSLRDTDSAMETAGKVGARVVLAPVTLGMSELRMYEIRLEEGCRSQGLPYNRMAHDCGYTQPMSVGDGVAAAALIQGMNQSLHSMRVPYQPLPMPQVQPQTNCVTNVVGNVLSTHCYPQ